MTPVSLGQAAGGLWLGACLAFILVVPGLVALGLAGHRARGFSRLALAVGASVTLWPLVLLWASLAGLAWSATGYRWTMLAIAAVAMIQLARGALRSPPTLGRLKPETIALAAVIGLAVGLRILHARTLVAPPWVDGYHHTLIAQLIAEHGAVPSGFRPYLPIDGFYYHFGFHALAAGAAWLAGVEVPIATLWMGQALNAATVLVVYVFARRLLEAQAIAVLAAALPATLYWFPSYFATWGRYTQLAGLVALPVVWILVGDAITARRPVRGQLLSGACAAGLLLVHYRVFAFFLIGMALLAVHAAFTRIEPRGRLPRLVATGVAGGVMAAPWLVRNFAGGVVSLAAASPTWYVGSAETAEMVRHVPDWLFTQGTNGFWIRLAIAGTVVGLARRNRAAVGLAAWCGLALSAVLPAWLGLPTSWLLPPFALAISAYIPVALGVALLAEAVNAAVRDAVDGGRQRWLFVAVAAAALILSGAWTARSPVDPMAGAPAWVVAPWRAFFGAGPPAPPPDRPVVLAWLAQWAGIGGLIGWHRRMRHARRARIGVPAASISTRDEPGNGAPIPGAIAETAIDVNFPESAATGPGGGAVRTHASDGRPAGVWPGHGSAWAAAAVVVLSLAGAWRMRSVVNPATVIVEAPDVAAARWVRGHTPPTARFLVSTAHWHLGTYRGLDGGYWLPLTTGRATSMPAALYVYGRPADVAAVTAVAEVAAKGDRLTEAELRRLMDDAGARYVYVGTAAAGQPGKLTAGRLRRQPELVQRFAQGGVYVFERRRR